MIWKRASARPPQPCEGGKPTTPAQRGGTADPIVERAWSLAEQRLAVKHKILL